MESEKRPPSFQVPVLRSVRERLYRDREYVLRVRLYYADVSGQTAVFMY